MGFGTSTTIKRTSRPQVDGADRTRWHQRAAALYEDLKAPATGLVRNAYGLSFSPDEIEDIYSSAWLGTLRSLESRACEMSDKEVRSYVLTAVGNQAGKELRRRRRKPVAPLEAAGEIQEPGTTPEDAAETRETREVTRDLLASLPPRRRAVMLLRYGWGLDPTEVCEMVRGLSPRAYRKEISKGVDELASRIRLVEDGRWCKNRESVLKAYAAGLADEDQTLQAQTHLAHCRGCSEFVGKLTGHLHDVSGALLVPGALEAAADGHMGVLGRVKEAAESTRESVVGVLSRSDPGEVVAAGAGARGAGVAGVGIATKLSAMSTGGKAALACIGGTVAATACVATGVVPFGLEGASGERERSEGDPIEAISPGVEPVDHASGAIAVTGTPGPAQAGSGSAEVKAPKAESDAPVVSRESALEPATPPASQEFGVESAATPVGGTPSSSSAGGNDSGSGGGAVAQEFGP
jgi:RNA polymerase sigma factor (sigma-70 family)